MAKSSKPDQIIGEWMVRDLSQAARDDELPRAFEVDDLVAAMADVMSAGRCPVLVGESGVGKTAIIYEFVRRMRAGDVCSDLKNRRVLQLSFEKVASGLTKPWEQLPPKTLALVTALRERREAVLPFFGDFHRAYQYSATPLLENLANELRGALIGEGTPAELDSMLEYHPTLEERFFRLRIDPPEPERVLRILDQWAAHRRGGPAFEPAALEQGVYLAHRFFARSHLPRSAIDLLVQVASLAGKRRIVTSADVIDRFCATQRTPRVLVDPGVALDLGELEATFGRQILGQPEAVDAAIQTIGRIKSGLADARRPFGVFLFVGPTGVGKTHLAQLLAEYLFGSRDRMIRFNMAEHSGEYAVGELFGLASADALAQRRGLLTRRLTGCPFGVLLLDEFEKAHRRVHDAFLQLVDEGTFVNGAGETISCRSMIIIVTSNAGAEMFRGPGFGFATPAGDRSRNLAQNRKLEEHFRFELLNRFDHIVHFAPLSREDIRRIARRELDDLQSRPGLRRGRLELELDESVLDWLTVNGYDPEFGARFLRRTMERSVTAALAEVLVRDRPPPGARVALLVRGNRIIARVVAPIEPAAREPVRLPVGTKEQIRTLDATSLMAAARDCLGSANPRLAQWQRRRQEYSALLAQMNEPSFWDRSPERDRLLSHFRELDVTVEMENRFADPILRLRDLAQRPLDSLTSRRAFARTLEEAAFSLSRWNDQLAEEGPAAAWLTIQNLDPLRPAGAWISDLTEMELAWCRHLRLSASIVAYGQVDGELARVVLAIEGPGAAGYLAMEAGVHRMARRKGADSRALIEVIPKSEPTQPDRPLMTRARRASGPFDLATEWRGRVELPARGLVIELFGVRQESFSHCLLDLSRAWRMTEREASSIARNYSELDGMARDPRTGGVVPRLRDVLDGKLDTFLEAWRRPATSIAADPDVAPMAAGEALAEGR